MIRPGRPVFSYCLPMDENGITLAEMVLDELARIDFQNVLKEYGFDFYGPNMHCMFELDRLSYLVNRPGVGTFQSPAEAYFFPFQMEAIKHLNEASTVLKTIPEEVLETYLQAE